MWYAKALANSIAGVEQEATIVDINAAFNSEFSWYYGADGGASNTQHDFITVVMHEIAHGIAYSGSVISEGTVQTTEILRENFMPTCDK